MSDLMSNFNKEHLIGDKELVSLKKNKYNSKDKSKYTFVLQNKITKAIVEINANSSLLASKIVGWRPRHVQIISVQNNEE